MSEDYLKIYLELINLEDELRLLEQETLEIFILEARENC